MQPGKAALTTLAAVLAALAIGAPPAAAEPTPQEAEALGKQAYDYGFPLLEILRVRKEMTSVACPDHRGNAPVNSFSNARKFATPEDRTVVAPNTDTLYSIAHLDLSRGAVVIGHPRMGKRYYSFELVDPYTNVIDIRGLRKDGGAAGSFAIRWKGHPGKGKAKLPPDTTMIKSKYRRVWVIGRTLAKGESDQQQARKLMAKYTLTLPDGGERSFPKGCKPGEPISDPTPTEGAAFIERLNAAMVKNPPPKRDDTLLGQLATVGVGPGLSPDQAGLSSETLDALYAGVADEAAALPGATRLFAYTSALGTQGWYLPAPNIGAFGTDYGFRAQVAVAGLGANTPDEAIYPTAIADAEGRLLNGSHDYRLTFAPGDAPPAKYFWSLTMYDSDGFLVANPIDRYSLGTSHPPLLEQPDGSIVFAIQDTEPAESDVNWLPAPAAGGFRLNLRLYGPSKAARTGAWRPPGVVRLGG